MQEYTQWFHIRYAKNADVLSFIYLLPCAMNEEHGCDIKVRGNIMVWGMSLLLLPR